jgi:hypothetical protein
MNREAMNANFSREVHKCRMMRHKVSSKTTSRAE